MKLLCFENWGLHRSNLKSGSAERGASLPWVATQIHLLWTPPAPDMSFGRCEHWAGTVNGEQQIFSGKAVQRQMYWRVAKLRWAQCGQTIFCSYSCTCIQERSSVWLDISFHWILCRTLQESQPWNQQIPTWMKGHHLSILWHALLHTCRASRNSSDNVKDSPSWLSVSLSKLLLASATYKCIDYRVRQGLSLYQSTRWGVFEVKESSQHRSSGLSEGTIAIENG